MLPAIIKTRALLKNFFELPLLNPHSLCSHIRLHPWPCETFPPQCLLFKGHTLLHLHHASLVFLLRHQLFPSRPRTVSPCSASHQDRRKGNPPPSSSFLLFLHTPLPSPPLPSLPSEPLRQVAGREKEARGTLLPSSSLLIYPMGTLNFPYSTSLFPFFLDARALMPTRIQQPRDLSENLF